MRSEKLGFHTLSAPLPPATGSEDKELAYDKELADRLLEAVGTRSGVSEKAMFGGLCVMLNGNMLCGVAKNRFMFRVGKDGQAAALARDGASPMDFTGRPLAGYVYVETDCTDEALADWVGLAAAYVDVLPVKKPKI